MCNFIHITAETYRTTLQQSFPGILLTSGLVVPQPAQPLRLHNVVPGDCDATESLSHETVF